MHHGVEALAVVVDDPPAVAQALLPAFDQSFVDIAFVEFRVAQQSDHAAFGAIFDQTVGFHIVLNQRREDRLGDAEPDRACREVDVLGVLGP